MILTGTKIVTDEEVSVISGHESGNVPSNLYFGDHLIEQIPSLGILGK